MSEEVSPAELRRRRSLDRAMAFIYLCGFAALVVAVWGSIKYHRRGTAERERQALEEKAQVQQKR